MQQETIISPAQPLKPASWVGSEGKCVYAHPLVGVVWDSGHGTAPDGGDLLPTKTSRGLIQSFGMSHSLFPGPVPGHSPLICGTHLLFYLCHGDFQVFEWHFIPSFVSG